MINLKDYNIVNNVAYPKPAKKSKNIKTKEISKKTYEGETSAKENNGEKD